MAASEGACVVQLGVAVESNDLWLTLSKPAQLTAGCLNVISFSLAEHDVDTALHQDAAEFENRFGAWRLVGKARYGIVRDNVEHGSSTSKEFHELLGALGRIVEALEQYILKRQSPAGNSEVPFGRGHDGFDSDVFVYRYKSRSKLICRSMKADSKLEWRMSLSQFVDRRRQANSTDRDAAWTDAKSVIAITSDVERLEHVA